MSQNALSKWLKVIIIAMALGGLFIYAWFFPALGTSIQRANPEFSHCYYPWLVLLWVTAIPCYRALYFAWKIAGNIGRDRAFTRENGVLFQRIANAAAVDALFFAVMNIVYLCLNMNHPGIVLASFVIGLTGGAVYIVCSGLSTLVTNSAELQEQSDLTI